MGIYIYSIGCLIALIMGIYEMIECERDYDRDYEPEYGYLIPYIMLSWFTVVMNIINYCKKHKNK